MSLKLILFPGILIISLTIIFGYIRPDIITILEKRATEAAKRSDLAKVESIETNVQTLSQSIRARQETEHLVQRYLPLAVDQERAVDMVNFLAQQSGVVVTSLYIKDSTPPPSVNVQPITTLAGEGEVVTMPDAAPEPPKSYAVQVTVLGVYENIRSFFERLHRTDRLHQTELMAIKRPIDRPQQNLPESFLEGVLTLDLKYYPEKRSGNALNQPLFAESSLDFGAANTLADFINSPVGDLVQPAVGRVNPFEPLP